MYTFNHLYVYIYVNDRPAEYMWELSAYRLSA